mmetsp:Transcript_12738/g.31416  ORF Transcript_12738/g.31416 Transcript_12738/m.31416 type:complete len:278 (-) Transcript_12738:17-850(-)
MQGLDCQAAQLPRQLIAQHQIQQLPELGRGGERAPLGAAVADPEHEPQHLRAGHRCVHMDHPHPVRDLRTQELLVKHRRHRRQHHGVAPGHPAPDPELDVGEGRPPFADVEFRVGGGVAWGHAVVLAAVSAVLHQELLRAEVTNGVRVVHVDAAVSRPEVLRFVLGVCYGRTQGCPFTSASQLWQLLYLVLRYELPRQLRSLTIQALHVKLPEDADTCAALLTRGTAVRVPWKIQLLAAHVLFSEGVGKPQNSGRVSALSTALDCLETAVFSPPVSQ